MRKLRITPIGTCRINTPLKRAAAKFPIELETDRVYGFVHSSDEALQQIRFLQGDKAIPEEIQPITFRPDIPIDYNQARWTPPDLNVVEISSAKLLSSNGHPVQINYVYRYFADFFADSARTLKFWSLVKKKDRRAVLEFLRDEPTYRRLDADARALLTSLTMEQQGFNELKRDMDEIADRLGRDNLVFVSHVNAATPDGALIPARDRLIRWVKLAAEQINVPCFDPTEAMREFGQERAMDNHGFDLTHYTPAFSDRVFALLHQDHVSKLVEAGPFIASSDDDNARQQILADNVEAMIDFDFHAGSRKLFEVLRQNPESGPLLQLRGLVLSKIGDFEGAKTAFLTAKGSTTLSQEARVAFLDSLVHTQDWGSALRVAEDLLADEYEDTAIYEGAAQASEHLGLEEQAIGFWKQSFRHDRSNLRAALNALLLIARCFGEEHLNEWKAEVIENAEEGDGVLEVAQWALANRQEDLFVGAFRVILGQNPERAEDILHSAVRSEMNGAVSLSLKMVAELPDQVLARRRFKKLAGEVMSHAAELIEKGEMRAAFDLASAAGPYASATAATRIVRNVTNHFRDLIRQAYGRDDYQAVVALAGEAGDIIFQSSRLGLLVGISLSRLERNAEARETFRRLHQIDPVNAEVLRWSGRLARADGDYATALRMFGALLRSDEPAADRFREESRRFFERAGHRALKQVRDLGRGGRFEEAIELAEAVREETELSEEADLELSRLHRLLRLRLREIEQAEGELEQREPVLRLMDRVKPHDEAVLRRLALEFMRQFRFDEAADYWERLDAIKPNVESVVFNRQRCRILAARKQRSSITEAAA